MRKILLLLVWFPSALFTIFISSLFLLFATQVKGANIYLRAQAKELANDNQYQFYAAMPNVLGSMTSAVQAGDARFLVLKNFLDKYRSPITPHDKIAQLFVDKADEYGLSEYRLALAIAAQESNLGEHMPSEDCHNPWGWGIHSRGTLCFKSWEEAIDQYISGLMTKYADILEITDREEMLQKLMERYAPRSLENGGSWKAGVRHFLEEME